MAWAVGKEGRESYICIQVIYYEVFVKILFFSLFILHEILKM